MSSVATGESGHLALTDAVVESLRYMGSFSQRSLKYFDMTPASTRLVAKRAPPVDNMLISRQAFKVDVMKEYERTAVGKMRQVVAATGIGKSTTFPCEISSVTGQNGLILSPRADLSYFNGSYLADHFVKKHYPGVTPLQLRSDHAMHPAQGKILYYDSAASFFMMFAIHRNLLNTLGIKFILFDESHELTAEYKLAELLATAGVFSDVKILLVSATKGDTSMEHETSETQRRLVPTAPELLELGNIDSLHANSPLHYSSINTKVMVFVPSLHDINAAYDYYERYDIPVFVHTSASSSTGMPKLIEFLHDNPVCVVLTDRILETGFTFDFSNVIDCGYTQEMVIDIEKKRVRLEKRPVTMAERKQRCGRSGRMGPGKAFFADLESTPERKGISTTTACYLALWCRVYNLSTNLPEVVAFKDYFGEMTHRKAMMLLHCYVHPILANPYMDMQGRMCHGWEKVFNHAVKVAEFEVSDVDKNNEIVADWVYQNVYDERFVEQLEQIRVPMSVPDEWVAFFYAVWKSTDSDGKRWAFDTPSDRRSVLSVAPDDYKRRKNTWYRPTRVRDSSATLAYPTVGHFSHSRKNSAVSPVEEELEVPTPDRALFSQATSFSVPTVGNVKLDIPIKKDKAVGFSTGTNDREIGVSKIDSPTFSVSLHDYKQVKVSTFHIEKVYPYDTELLKIYLADPARRERDVDRVEDLKKFRVKLHGMDLDNRNKYVISMIRCWNYNVVGAVQLQADDSKPSFFSSRPTVAQKVVKLEKSLDGYKVLMSAMELEGVRFAVKRSGRHGSSDSVKISDSSLVNDRLDYLAGKLSALVVDGGHRGLFLRDGACIASVLHVFERDGRIDRPSDVHSITIARSEDLVVMNMDTVDNVGILGLVRPPISAEQVYIITISGKSVRTFEHIQVFEVAGKWFHTAEGTHGMSGAPIVAKQDGKLLGFHLGASDVFPFYKSTMAPLSVILK